MQREPPLKLLPMHRLVITCHDSVKYLGIDLHATHEHASMPRLNLSNIPRARALMHMSCTCAQYATAHISAVFSLSRRYSFRTSPHSVTQGSVSLRFAAHFPHLKDPVHMLNLRHLFIRSVSS